MADPDFDAEGVYDQDYLHFYASPGAPAEHQRETGAARSDADADLITRLLGPVTGLAILDLACGYGRLANRLAARGAQVSGLDSSPVFLDRARADAAALGVSVDYQHGDLRALPWTARFDAVLSWFTAFGYFGDRDNRRVLDQVARALRPGGRLVMDLNNVTGWLPDLQAARLATHRDGDMVVDDHRLDPLTARLLVRRTIIRGGRVRQVPFYVRMFLFPELRDWLLAAGFTEVHGRGEDGGPLRAEHTRMIVTAIKP